ncbi:Aste57867_14275 [Aphanomyces stellatus]|uniref:Aste57867_14275 protein n=1 Tax=Aphanomyces stellatus TaxID=120398 RepID=A0A485L0B1_9STRA|nr:hypothetical protein As57867_014223 [Aphanomyces stellatus]VFT91100.1 Aste57867_14275 [Aphanomyces stellatus]
MNASKAGAMMAAPAADAAKPGEFIGKCQYKTGKCFKERTLKRNGQAHSLCEEHRVKQNLIQRRSDRKYQSLHAVRRKERSQLKAMFKKQVTMAVAQQLYLEHQQKILTPLVFHQSLAPSAPSHPHAALVHPSAYHALPPPASLVHPSSTTTSPLLPRSAYDSPVVTAKHQVPQVISPGGAHVHPVAAAALLRKPKPDESTGRTWKDAKPTTTNDDDDDTGDHESHHAASNNAADSWTEDDVQLLQSILLV